MSKRQNMLKILFLPKILDLSSSYFYYFRHLVIYILYTYIYFKSFFYHRESKGLIQGSYVCSYLPKVNPSCYYLKRIFNILTTFKTPKKHTKKETKYFIMLFIGTYT